MNQILRAELVRKRLGLTPQYWQAYLLLSTHQLVTYDLLNKVLWPDSKRRHDNSIRVFMCKLRKTVGAEIKIIYDLGYYIPEHERKRHFAMLKNELDFLVEIEQDPTLEIKAEKYGAPV